MTATTPPHAPQEATTAPGVESGQGAGTPGPHAPSEAHPLTGAHAKATSKGDAADEREQRVRAERDQLRRELDRLLAGDTLLRDSIAEAKRQFPGAHLDFNLTGNLCVIWLDVYVAWIDVVGSGGLTVFPGARGVVQPTDDGGGE